MDTLEHTKLGNALKIANVENNPYFRTDENGVVHIRLQRFTENNLPEPMDLELTTGEIIAMAGDYFTQADWTGDLNLPHCEHFDSPSALGKYLISTPSTDKEELSFISAYNNLAAPDVTRKQIDRIYSINKTNYMPFSPTLNAYMQQIMLFLRVKNYGEMITRNQTHFAPWSIKVYVLGHDIALRFAQLSYELKQLAENKNFHSSNKDFKAIKQILKEQDPSPSPAALIDLAYRYQAQAYAMELFTFHYYTDHFATGHMSMVSDLRLVAQERFGTLGSILANNLHDELNRVGIYTNCPYDFTPQTKEPATPSRGDGKFNTCLNKFNRQHCFEGMTDSLDDLKAVLTGSAIPDQSHFGGLKKMPDVDFNVRQHQPLMVYSQDKVYCRIHPSKINIISPSEYEKLRANPLEHGYKEVKNKWDAFLLVTKLRLFPYFYNGQVQPLTSTQKAEIKLEEKLRCPSRKAIPQPHCKPEAEPSVLDWRTRKELMDTLDGLHKHSVLQFKRKKHRHHEHRPEVDAKPSFSH